MHAFRHRIRDPCLAVFRIRIHRIRIHRIRIQRIRIHRIRIHRIRIRMQLFWRIRIYTKIYYDNSKIYNSNFFLQKPSYICLFNPLQRTLRSSNMKFAPFLPFWGDIFDLPGSRFPDPDALPSRIWIPDPWVKKQCTPDPESGLATLQSESGSETLLLFISVKIVIFSNASNSKHPAVTRDHLGECRGGGCGHLQYDRLSKQGPDK
jgi:hypothetical protein